MSLKQGAALGIQTGLSCLEPTGHRFFGSAPHLEPPPTGVLWEREARCLQLSGTGAQVCARPSRNGPLPGTAALTDVG